MERPWVILKRKDSERDAIVLQSMAESPQIWLGFRVKVILSMGHAPMTSPISEMDLPHDHLLRQLIDAIAAHPEVREPLLRVLLTEDFLSLPSRVDKLQGEFEEFREETRAEFRSVNERLDAANERLDDNTKRLDAANERLDATNEILDATRLEVRTLSQRMDENTRAIRRLEGHVGRLTGNAYEDKCRDQIGVILDGWLDGPIIADRGLINAKLLEARQNNAITREEYLDGLRPDIIAREVADIGQTGRLAIVEASVTFNRGDLENAARRAAIITRVIGVGTAAFVATHSGWPDEVNDAARQLGVTIIRHEDPDFADV